MRIPRVYTALPLASSTELDLDGDAALHIAAVLRLKPGATLAVFNQDDGEFIAIIVESHRTHVRIHIGESITRYTESPVKITLVQGISRGERMDFTIQKSVELGVAEIQPVFTGRSVVQLDGNRLKRRHTHWQKIAIAASEQCGRIHIPIIGSPKSFNDWLGSMKCVKHALMLDPDSKRRIENISGPVQEATLLVGPEGGLTDLEKNQSKETGFLPICIGPRILRTETAAVVCLSLLQARWGDL